MGKSCRFTPPLQGSHGSLIDKMATILKSRQIADGTNVGQIEVFNWEDVASRAKQYLQTVRDQAAEMLRSANEESQKIRQYAQEQGLAAGQGDLQATAQSMANQMAEERILNATKNMELLADQLEQSMHQWLRQWQHETVPLAIAIAERLVHRQIEIDPTILLNWLQDSVRLLQGNQVVQLRMNPLDIATLGTGLDRLLENIGAKMSIELVPDETIGKHGLRLQSPDTTIDQQLSVQFERLREELQ